MREWWRRYAGTVAFVTVLVVFTFALDGIRESQVEGCGRQNELRAIERTTLHDEILDERDEIVDLREEIARSKALKREDVLPDLSPKQYERLIREKNERNLASIARKRGAVRRSLELIPKAAPVDCEAKYRDVVPGVGLALREYEL